MKTVKKVEVPDYGPNSPNAEFAYGYDPIGLRIFGRIMRDLPFSAQASTFVDLGSGKGRALILAGAYDFERIVGVELCPDLHRIAEENTRTPRAQKQLAGRLKLHCMDAASYELPAQNCVVFLYNPFAEQVLTAVLDRIEQHSGQLAIVYRNPKFGDLLEKRERLTLSRATRHYRIYVNSKQAP